VGIDRLVALLGLGSEGDRGTGDVAHLRGCTSTLETSVRGPAARAALLLVVAFGMVLVTYSGSLWFNGLHAYSGLN